MNRDESPRWKCQRGVRQSVARFVNSSKQFLSTLDSFRDRDVKQDLQPRKRDRSLLAGWSAGEPRQSELTLSVVRTSSPAAATAPAGCMRLTIVTAKAT